MLALDAPAWLKNCIGKFSLSYHQGKLLARYVTGLIASTNKTISGISSVFMKQSMRAMNRLMTEYPWDTSRINMERLEELQEHNETRWSKYGILIIDDTIVEKRGKHIPYVGKFYDHAEKRFVNGHCIVSMHYADSKTNYAIDYRPYVKKGSEEFRTKIELAKELVGQYSFIPAQTVVWDTWYTCNDMVQYVCGKHEQVLDREMQVKCAC
ncbi:MAG: transposase [Nitrososphaerales archaeon]